MTSSFSSYQESSKKSALAAVKKGADTVRALLSECERHFPADRTLSQVRASYSSAGEAALKKNEACQAAVSAAMDAVHLTQEHFAVLDRYVALTIPRMEDGNNFGVTVQLAAAKHMSDANEKLDKGIDELSKYAASRADALEKCKSLPSTSTTASTTTTDASSESTSTDKEKGDCKSTDKKSSKEEKKTTSSTESADGELRLEALLSVDVLFYSKAKRLYQQAVTGLLSTLDFMEKNAEKISKPKGSRDGGHAYSSMY